MQLRVSGCFVRFLFLSRQGSELKMRAWISRAQADLISPWSGIPGWICWMGGQKPWLLSKRKPLWSERRPARLVILNSNCPNSVVSTCSEYPPIITPILGASAMILPAARHSCWSNGQVDESQENEQLVPFKEALCSQFFRCRVRFGNNLVPLWLLKKER